MTVHQYKKVKFGLMITLVGIVAAFLLQSQLTPWESSLKVFPIFFALLLYMVVVSLLKTRVKGVLADERQIQVSEKAAQVSFQILLPMLALTSVALMSGGGYLEFYYVKALGTVISYVTCLGLLIYLLSYWYFDKESGGK
jgi:uncharacterized membrane protein